ncbi:C-Jun-amino-terminal kinase-interacting protein 2 isoform X1 [Gadus morhua]|uniref:Mitogen-activated protein kinase 8 interacting protein 2 n=1 Tax=Gadus morhua TaxID=8049 RepID=A0A8C4ZEZ7_GADMO|nr:C-Jun-amino-terminal kinase-interacting protein 2 isoform X1 [Gadus morhua]
MADRAEMFSLSTFHSLSPPGCRPSHDISLEEFDDEDLSEITDDCGIGLNYDSDPYEKDCLILEKNEMHHPMCSFQDDFQEFEMIDDEDEEEDDEDGDEDEEELDPDGPPSPSASPPDSPTLDTQKSRPTTLNLTTAGSQDSLNNNSSLSPKKGSWQDSIRNPIQQGRLSPNHSCLDDGIHVTGQCPATPVSQAPGPQSKGTPPKQTGEGRLSQSPHRPLLCDVEGNRRERPEYGSFGQHQSNTCPGDVSKTSPEPLNRTSRVPSVDENSQCSDTEVDRDLINDHNHKHLNRRTTDTYTVTSESGMEPENDLDPDATSHCLSSTAPIGGNDGADTPLSDEELDKDFEVEFMCKETYDLVCKENHRSSYVEFPCIEPFESAAFSSYISTDHPDALDPSNGAAHDDAAANDSTSPSSDPGIADMNTKRGYVTDQDQDLSSPASDSDVEGELEAAFVCGGHLVSNMISSISETELDLTSDDSSSGRSSHLTNSIEEASSPTSDQELDPDTELEQDSGIVGMKASLLLGQHDPIKVGYPLSSSSPLPSPTLATPSPVDSPIEPLGSYDDGEALGEEDLQFEHHADPDETLPTAQRSEDSFSREMVLEIEPDHSLESFKRSFYLPVGPRLMPSTDDYGTSEGDSDSESEDELSENSDSPWLLSNLVNKMISEGSYPISCPEECFKRKLSVSDTISPSSDIDEDDDRRNQAGKAGLQEGGKASEGLRDYVTQAEERGKNTKPGLHASGHTGSSGDVDLSTSNARETTRGSIYNHCSKDSDKNLAMKWSKNDRRQEERGEEDVPEPNNDLMMHEGQKELDSPSLTESVISDKDEGRETDPKPTGRSSASLERITEVKQGLTLDIPTAQTNRCFSLSYSTDNDEEDVDEDSSPFLTDLRKQSAFGGSNLYLDSSPPIDESVQNRPFSDQDLCDKALAQRQQSDDDGLAYDSMKYTLVVDENTTLELVSLRRCTSVLSDDSELSTLCDEEPLGTGEAAYGLRDEEVRAELLSSSEDSSPEADLPFSKKFLNVFVNSTSRSSSTESFGLFSCTINGEDRDQTHRAVYRFIPRHADELELDVDDPLYVEEEEDDYWYRGYNMRTGERGIFPAFYAHEVIGQSKETSGVKRNPAWIETFNVQFLGSVEVPHHQGNGILCAAMQKIAISRKRTVHVRPPSLCELEISLQGVKLIMSLEDEYDTLDEFDRCSHFFQMKNISFCGCHPKNNCYFGFITKHPMLNRFACHVFVSQESMRRVAECVGKAFQEYYQEHLEYACPTEDIYLE